MKRLIYNRQWHETFVWLKRINTEEGTISVWFETIERRAIFHTYESKGFKYWAYRIPPVLTPEEYLMEQ